MRKRFGIMLSCVFAWTLALLCLTAPARAGTPGNSPTGFMAVWTVKQPDEKPEGIEEPEKEEEAEEEKTEEKEQDNTVSFVLPAGLKIIEAEAFEGTAIRSIALPALVEVIGDRAFANIPTLRGIHIPEKTRIIARSAFSGSDQVTITGVPGSYARRFARENGIPFAPTRTVYAGIGASQLAVNAAARPSRMDADDVHAAENGKIRKDTQWRPIGEIKADQNDQLITNHISGRAPPACA